MITKKKFVSPAVAVDTALVGPTPLSHLSTVKQFAAKYPAFTEPAIRGLIFKAESRQSTKGIISGNGLVECGAIIRIGRKILIDEVSFFNWVSNQKEDE